MQRAHGVRASHPAPGGFSTAAGPAGAMTLMLMLTMGLVAPGAGAADAPRVYYDYATVVDVRPLRGDSPPAGDGASCLDGAAPLPDGVVSPLLDGESIATAVLRERDALVAPSCGAGDAGGRVSGYEVTYRYHDRLYRRVLASPPGDRIRVRVEMAAAP